jgi:hypothetical protein
MGAGKTTLGGFMRISAMIGMLMVMGMVSVEAAKKPANLPKLQKIALVALARDASRAAEVEAAVKDRFVQKGVAADRSRNNGVSPSAGL